MNEELLKKLQKTELKILMKVDEVCRHNDLTYYLASGSLLGAVRHKGFIPWDDDIDIYMPRDDYNRFIKMSIKGELGKDYFLHHYKTDPHYWLTYAKVRKNNTVFEEKEISDLECHKGVFVDVFPLDYSSKKIKTNSFKFRIIKELENIIMVRVLTNSKNPSIYSKILFGLTRILSIKTINRIIEKIICEKKEKDYLISYAMNLGYNEATMPKNWFGNPKTIEFENKYVYVPSESEKILEQIYGDYMQMPPIDERENHNPARIIL